MEVADLHKFRGGPSISNLEKALDVDRILGQLLEARTEMAGSG